MEKRTRRIAPRLTGGTVRLTLSGRLAPVIKEGLRDIAKSEGMSMSWVVEEVLIDYFGLKRPRYLKAIETSGVRKMAAKRRG